MREADGAVAAQRVAVPCARRHQRHAQRRHRRSHALFVAATASAAAAAGHRDEGAAVATAAGPPFGDTNEAIVKVSLVDGSCHPPRAVPVPIRKKAKKVVTVGKV